MGILARLRSWWGDRSLLIGEFVPCVIFHEEAQVTEILLEDTCTVWCSLTSDQGVELGYASDGRLIGVKFWADVTTREKFWKVPRWIDQRYEFDRKKSR